MIRGITSVDTAFEIAGLIQAGNLMRFLFMDTFIGKAAMLVSCLLSFKESLYINDVKKSIFYILMLLSLWCFVLIPMISIGKVDYSVKQTLMQESRIEYLLERQDYAIQKVPLFLNLFSQMVISIIKGSVVALDSFRRDGMSYLKKPMEKALLIVELHKTISLGIQPHDLRDRVAIFCQDIFLPQVQKIKSIQAMKGVFLWPGHEGLIKLYTQEQQQLWGMLAQDILKNINNQQSILERMNNVFKQQQESLGKMVLEEVFKQEFKLRSRQYAFKSWTMLKKKERINNNIQIKTMFLKESFIEQSSWLQGMFLFYGYAVFPVVFLIGIFVKKYVWIGFYLLGLFWLRFLNVIWACIDQTSAFLLNGVMREEKIIFEKMMHITDGTAFCMIFLPMITWMLMGWILKEKTTKKERI